MKINKLLAVATCCALLLTGCANETSSNESISTDSTNVESYIETTQSSTSSDQSVSSSTVSEPPKIERNIPVATLDQDAITVYSEKKYMNVPFTTDIPFDPDVQYYLRIYFSDSGYSADELRYDEPFDISETSINLKLHNGGNYYNIQFYSDEKEGEYSNQIFYIFKPVIKHNTFEFYTMLAAAQGEQFECLFGYPDYAEVDYYLEQGIKPEYINVDVYYRCPYCFTETYCDTVKFSYNKGELCLIPNVRCGNTSCSHRSGASNMLFSRIK